MSLREVDFALNQINKRRHNNISLQARLQGIDIPMIETDEFVEAFTEEKDKVLTGAMQEAIDRVTKEIHG